MKKYFKKLTQNSMMGRKMRFNLKLTMFAIVVIGFIAAAATVSFADRPVESTISILTAGSFIAFAKKESELTLDEKQTLGTVEKQVNDTVGNLLKGVISKDVYEKQMEGIVDKLKSLDEDGKFGKAITELVQYQAILKDLGAEIDLLKKNGISLERENGLTKAIDEMLNSEKFNRLVDEKTKSSGKFTLDLKDATSMTDNYTGTQLISQQQNKVITQVSERKINFRDLMIVDSGDPSFPMLTFTQIYELDRNAAFTSENGRLSKSSFKIKEVSSETKRVGTYLELSRRLLKSRSYVRSWLMNRLHSWVKMAEDFQIMFGDGTGNNLKGITKHEEVKCVSRIITAKIIEGKAGSIKAVESFNEGAQTVLEFSTPYDSIVDGQKITISGATTFTALNGTHLIHKMSDREIMIDVEYAEGGNVSAAIFDVKNNFFNTVESPDMGDAVKAIFAVMSYAEYTPNVIAMNPSTIFEAETAKDTTGRTLGLVTTINGVKHIAGRAVVETTALLPGKYFVGDMLNGASIVDYGTISIEFAEDVESRIKNQIAVIIDEEIIMPVYNPWAFAYGNISDVLNAIKKA